MQNIAGGELINVDTNEGLAAAVKEDVLAAPTVIFYADGKETARAHTAGEIDEILGTKKTAQVNNTIAHKDAA